MPDHTPAPTGTTTRTEQRTVEVSDVSVRFRKNRFAGIRQDLDALVGIDLTATSGEVLGILGPNGSGKTTLFRVLAGELEPTSGSARVFGLDPTARELTARVGYQPEGPLPFSNLPGGRFLRHMGALSGLSSTQGKEAASHWLDRLDLSHAADRPLRDYSTGMRKRLALCAALLGDPELLILDEPTAGLDPDGSERILEILQERAAAGGTVLLASHHLQEVEQACQRIVVLSAGHLVREGSLEDLLDNEERALILRHIEDEKRPSVEAAARAAGAEVIDWRRGQRHLFSLFRELREETRRSDP